MADSQNYPPSTKIVAVSLRVDRVESYGEQRDALDQRWVELLLSCGCLPLLIPNQKTAAQRILNEFSIDGVLLTGGNDLSTYGGQAPERDETETFLLEHALKKKIPLLGVCRGMQVIQNYYGVPLKKVVGHVTREQTIQVLENPRVVNSFHDYGTTSSSPELETWAVADDGIIKAIRHNTEYVAGFMWHPERNQPFQEPDMIYIKNFFLR